MNRTLQNQARHEELPNLDAIVGGAPTTTQPVVDAKDPNHHVVIAIIAILIG